MTATDRGTPDARAQAPALGTVNVQPIESLNAAGRGKYVKPAERIRVAWPATRGVIGVIGR